jgi:hypothetical protein
MDSLRDAEPVAGGPAVAVLGACGGAGASSFAAALAAVPPPPARRCTLLDLDGIGGGADVLLGLEHEPGARWSDIRLGGGTLAPEALRDRLPAAGPIGVLAWDEGAQPADRDVEQVVGAARAAGPVVLDLPRWLPGPARAALRQVDIAVVLIPGEVRALLAADALLRRLDGLGVRAGPVLRPGVIDGPGAAALLGREPIAVLPRAPWLGGDAGGVLRVEAVPRGLAAVANRVWCRIGGGW